MSSIQQYHEELATLQGYLKAIQHYKPLTMAEEQRLAKRVRDKHDAKAAHKLVQSHLRLVVKVATGYRGYGLPMAEVIQEGNMGLMQAVMRFDPARGFRLSTYAMWWIKAAIQEYILHSWSLVKIGTTAAQKKLFFNLRKLKSQLNEMHDGLTHDGVTKIAKQLGVKPKEVEEMNQRLAVGDQSLNTYMNEDGEHEWMEWVVDDRPGQEEIYAAGEEFDLRRKQLNAAMMQLDERERAIVVARYLRENPRTLESISHRFGISRERIRQLEVRAMKKLTQLMGGTASITH